MRSSIALLVLLFAAAVGPARVSAYCQATTVQAPLMCPTVCVTEGTRVGWETPEIEFALNMRGFPGLSDAAVRAALVASFSTWQDVACGGRPLGFRFSQLLQSTALTVGPIETEPNLNVISWLSAQEWAQLGFGSSEFARTKVWFDEHTGEIVGADIAFNGSIMPLTVCPDSTSCAPTAVDLQNVATHEIGHFLGLAHSADPAATMWCSAARGDHEKRSLGEDDSAGLCAIYKNGAAFMDQVPVQQAQGTPMHSGAGGGCAIGADRTARAYLPWGLLLLALRRRRALRRPTSRLRR